MHADNRLLRAACSLAELLRSRQRHSGLFDGDNLQSPPDTAFTANDMLDTLRLLEPLSIAEGTAECPDCGGSSDARLTARLRHALDACVDRVDAPLRIGGVHTPNHRWELCQALAKLDARCPDPARRARIDQWLGEGIDVDPDGQYSERSANYAAHVTNRSLLVLARELGRPELEDVVVRNLEAIVAMTDPGGNVETVHSRRQDQFFTVPLSLFHHQLRLVSITRGRGDLAWWCTRAWSMGVPDPGDELSNALLDMRCTEPLPEPVAPEPGERLFGSGLAVNRHRDRYLCVNGGSDRHTCGRTASGLARNPTFLHAWVGGVEIRSLRLSREFFALGPFRAEGIRRVGSGDAAAYQLSERVAANYYHPLPDGSRSADGHYPLEYEGRFAAAMAFSHRERDALTLSTEVTVVPRPNGFDLTVKTWGPCTRVCLEVALPDLPAGGVTRFEEGMWIPDAEEVTWGEGDGALRITIAGDTCQAPPLYEPVRSSVMWEARMRSADSACTYPRMYRRDALALPLVFGARGRRREHKRGAGLR
ncbi:hypothetical protein [Actinomyces ruminis]|uniref:Heparinase II/III-like protein n=1 Tax=Actinomyces ruminis TaxID=1937003 RepID=A0ABX4MH81_9ACTO|nr:hypothetical protein [Actinomyces ruminis]PHP53400.1 hypothetical protein BW737_002575 [Actinomyces ruminis]